MQDKIRETAKRNARRSPTLEYKVGDLVFLETSLLKKPATLAPLRIGPYAITKIVANGNAAFLEGFRHPFSVELLTPTLCFANGINPHLTQHQLDHNTIIPVNPEINVPSNAHTDQRVTELPHGEDVVVPTGTDLHSSSLQIEVELEGVTEEDVEQLNPQVLQEAVEDFLQDNQEVWEYQPEVRVVPSQPTLKPSSDIIRVRAGDHPQLGIAHQVPSPITRFPSSAPSTSVTGSTTDQADPEPIALLDEDSIQHVVQIPPHVILPAQLPGDITKILELTGRTRNSAVLLCLMSNGQKCSVTLRQLTSILGHARVEALLGPFKKSPPLLT
jgi:hypothetical protein